MNRSPRAASREGGKISERPAQGGPGVAGGQHHAVHRQSLALGEAQVAALGTRLEILYSVGETVQGHPGGSAAAIASSVDRR